MAGRADFTDEEWSVLTRAPKAVALTVMAAEAGGRDEVHAEVLALDRALQASTRDSDPWIVRLVADEIHPLDSFVPPQLDFVPLMIAAIELGGHTKSLLFAKVPAQDGKAYRQWLLALGRQVAGAAKEGGLLGMGGARITENEKAVLTVLSIALGIHQTE
ncbi:MAG: hypothetical protein AB7N70_15185 [Dehalococcoidia bacterium]